MQNTNVKPKVLAAITLLAFLAVSVGFFLVLKNSLNIRNVVQEDVRIEFLSYATTVSASQKFQVAELTQFESFEKTSSAKFMQIDLPDVIVGISAPVTFTYTVDFQKPWVFTLNGEYLEVSPPPLEFNPPAADLGETKFVIKQGSLLRNEEAVLKTLQREIGPLLQERGEANKALVLAVAQSSIEDFVKNWLVSKNPDGKAPKVRVLWGSGEMPIPPSK
jgi:hypothetical protein